MRRLLPSLVALVVLAGCSGDESSSGTRVAATTAHLADLARQVGGDRVRVSQLIPAGADPHDFEPSPRDLTGLARADVVLRSGGEVDEWLADAMSAAGGDAPVLTVLDEIPHDAEDPHWWQDPRNAIRAVALIEERLTGADPAGRTAYEQGADRLTLRLEDLDRAIASCVDRLPQERRKIVTTHDALGYYADRYGFTVVGNILPARTTQAQPSSRDVSALIATIRRERVRAIFTETSLDADLEQAIARESGATLGEPLFTDSLAEGGTYVDALVHNTRAIVAGAGGDMDACDL